MSTLQIFKGTVKYPTQQPKDYGYGLRVNAVVTLADGEEVKLWGKPGDPIESLEKGQGVTIAYDGKNYKLVTDAPNQTSDRVPEAPTTQSRSGIPIPPETKREIAAYVEELASLYGFCLDTATAKLGEKIPDPTAIKDVATTLFLTAVRRFNLQ